MKKFKLNEEDMKQIAHLFAKDTVSTIPPNMRNERLKKYIESYNNTMNDLILYNQSLDESEQS